MNRRSTGRNTWVALLRGINVGGRNRLPMSELARVFEDAGCDSVRTYIQSGNVVFEATRQVSLTVPETVAAALSARMGADIPVTLRSADDLRQAVEANPFPGAASDGLTLHLGFLAEQPAPHCVAGLDPDRSPPDELAVRGREIYLRLPNGAARTKFTNAYLERSLSTQVTFRNWKTVLALLEMAGG